MLLILHKLCKFSFISLHHLLFLWVLNYSLIAYLKRKALKILQVSFLKIGCLRIYACKCILIIHAKTSINNKVLRKRKEKFYTLLVHLNFASNFLSNYLSATCIKLNIQNLKMVAVNRCGCISLLSCGCFREKGKGGKNWGKGFGEAVFDIKLYLIYQYWLLLNLSTLPVPTSSPHCLHNLIVKECKFVKEFYMEQCEVYDFNTSSDRLS